MPRGVAVTDSRAAQVGCGRPTPTQTSVRHEGDEQRGNRVAAELAAQELGELVRLRIEVVRGHPIAAVVNRIVAEWVLSLDHTEVLARCAAAGAPASLIYSIADIFEDPQYRARGNIRLTESRIGDLAVPEVVPRLSGTPGAIR